jgi:hypothetical protein
MKNERKTVIYPQPPLKTTKKRPVWGVFDMAWHGGFAKNRVGL